MSFSPPAPLQAGAASSAGGSGPATGSAGAAGAGGGAAARHRAETRRRLVAAATALFAREGLHATTSTRIARSAGVAAGTFYLHFPDKQALFREIAFDALGRLRARLAEATARAGDGLERQLRARMSELVAFADEERDLVRILFGRGQEAGALGDELLEALLPDVEAHLRERIEQGLADAGLHPAVAAQALLATWARVLAWWVEDPSRAPRAAVVETLVRLHPVYRGAAPPDAR